MHNTVDEYLQSVEVDKIIYVNKIPIDSFIPKEHTEANPLTLKYKQYWLGEARKSIDGFWQEYQGVYKFIPGVLYFYGAHWHILLNPKAGRSKAKIIASPFVRDLEWIKSFAHMEMRGFSGFEGDDKYTCYREISYPEEERSGMPIPDSCYNKKGKEKEYKPAREMLREYFSKPLGKALFDNMAMNIVDLESRGGGKSYWMSNIAGHNYIFDGAQDFDEWIMRKRNKQPMVSETMVAAVDSKYSTDTLGKVQLGLDNLKGKYTLGSTVYPPPFERKYSGSWEVGKTITQTKEKKVGGQWEKTKGSKIQHRSFKDNPFAANGTRPSILIIDEIGFMGNLKEALVQLKECTADGANKFGSIWMTGTGGDMDGGSTLSVMSVFYDPKANECLEFEDHYEASGAKIGFFIPAWLGLNQFKDELGNTNVVAALRFLLRHRETLKKAKDKSALDGEMSQRPLVPSEVFLITGSNVFPVAPLREQLGFLQTTTDVAYTGVNGTVAMDPNGKVKFVPDLEGKVAPCDWPVKKGDKAEGCVTVWESPANDDTYGLYMGGIDPYDQDQALDSVSLGCMLVIKRASPGIAPYDMIVAEYTGRPHLAKEFYENCRLLAMLYNMVGTCLYENEKMGIKTYFENRHSLYLMANTPDILKANVESKVNRQIGQHMPQKVKSEVEILTRDWLLDSSGDEKLNLHRIFSVPLLKELINYNSKAGNYDRVIALMLCVVQSTQMYKIIAEAASEEEEVVDDFFTRSLFIEHS